MGPERATQSNRKPTTDLYINSSRGSGDDKWKLAPGGW